MNFSASPYCTLLFSRKENISLSEVALVAVHCKLPDQLQHDCVRMSLLKSYQYYSGYLLACRKWQLKHWNIMQSLFKLINKCTRTIEHRFAKVFLKPFLSLLTGKCWLGKAALTFCQINTVMSTYTCNVTHRFNESKNLTVM